MKPSIFLLFIFVKTKYLTDIGCYATFHLFRVKMIIEEIEREEAALREDLYSADRKFAEYYNVGEVELIYLILSLK